MTAVLEGVSGQQHDVAGHRPASCNTQSSAPEDGHVELTGIINKAIIVASSWLFILFISMMHRQANIR